MDKRIEGEIIDYLKKTRVGASITEISNKLNVSRPTLIKYLGIMKVQGIVDYKSVGMAKLWYLPREIELTDLIEEKDIISVLKRDQKTNSIKLFGRTRTIVPSRFIYLLCQSLTKKQQESIFKKITLQRISDYEKATETKLDKCSPKDKEDFMRMWINYRMNTGWGKLGDIKLDNKRKKLTVTLDQSEVAEAMRSYSRYKPKEPVCHLLSGVFLGFMHGAYDNTRFACKQTKCRIKDSVCEFIVEPI